MGISIEEYLEILDTMPYEEVSARCLMNDNFPFVLNGNIVSIRDQLSHHNFTGYHQFPLDETNQSPAAKDYVYMFNHTTGGKMQLIPEVCRTFPDIWPEVNFSQYNVAVTFHFDQIQITQASGLHYIKAGAAMTRDLVAVAKHLQIPLCIPMTAHSRKTNGLVVYSPTAI